MARPARRRPGAWCDDPVEIRELRGFVAVAEEHSVSAGARRLHVSQSSLSQVVQSLERQLGVQLLLRTSAGTTLTDAGERLLTEARDLVQHHDRAVLAVTAPRGAPDEASGTVRLAVPLEFPVDLLPRVLQRLDETHPGTRVEVRHASSAAQLTALESGELDVALLRDRPVSEHLDAVLAAREPMGVVLAAGRSAELAEPDGVHLHRLARLEWVGFPRSGSPAWRDQVRAILLGHGVAGLWREDPDERPMIAEVKLAAVGTGRAFALAAPGWARPLPPGLLWHPLVGDPVVRRTWAVWHSASKDRHVAALVDALDTAG